MSSQLDMELVTRYADVGRFIAAFELAETLAVDHGESFEKLVEVCLTLRTPSSEA
jgi:hypothetical protein